MFKEIAKKKDSIRTTKTRLSLKLPRMSNIWTHQSKWSICADNSPSQLQFPIIHSPVLFPYYSDLQQTDKLFALIHWKVANSFPSIQPDQNESAVGSWTLYKLPVTDSASSTGTPAASESSECSKNNNRQTKLWRSSRAWRWKHSEGKRRKKFKTISYISL